MTIHDSDNQKNLADLARQIDDELRSGGSSEGILTSGQNSNQNAKIDTLSQSEREELKAAKAALYFLNRVRVDLDNHSKIHESSVVLPGPSSTLNGLDTLNDNSNTSIEFKELGRFEIVKAIGQGGFAKVFLARDPQLDRDVAIKVLKAQALLSDESRRRFEREAKSAAVLAHPAILPIYETGNVGPITFIVSEYCPGTTLAEWFADSNRETDLISAAEIMAQLAEAVQHAHQRGVIHRDLKPSNVLVREGDGPIAQRVRITDFGLAKQLESDDITITTEGAVVGTPAYMSPEQALGTSEVDISTDIFSLGVMLYELLTGKLPFRKTNNLSTLNAVAHETPVSPRKVNSQVPRDLEAICLKCLGKRAEDRYANAFSLSADLNAWLEGRKVSARHATTTERIVRWVSREPALSAALLFALLSLAVGCVLTGWQWQAAQNNLVESNNQRDRALKNVHRIQTTVESVLDEYGQSLDENLYLNAGHRRIINEMVNVHKELIDDEAEQLNITASTIESYVKIARIHRKLGQHDKAQAICEQAQTLAELAIKNDPRKEADLRRALAEISVQKVCVALNVGRFDNAATIARKGLASLEKFQSPIPNEEDTYRLFMLSRHLGLALHGKVKYTEMLPWMEQGMNYASQLVDADPSNLSYQTYFGVSLQDVATAYRSTGRRNEATEYFERALLFFQNLGAQHPSEDFRYRIGYLHSELAETYTQQKLYEKAELQFVSSRTLLEELVAERPFDIDVYTRLLHVITREVTFRERIKQFDKAKALHELGLKMAESVKKDLLKLRYQMFFRVQHASVLINHFARDRDEWVNDSHIDDLLTEAIEIGEQAIVEFPRDYILKKHLTEAYRHKARVLHYRDQFTDAHAAFDRGTEVALMLLRANQDHRQTQTLGIKFASYSAKRAAQYARFEDAKLFLLDLSGSAPKSVHVQYQSAKRLAQLAGEHQVAGHSADEVDEIRQLSIKTLRRAIENGFSSPKVLVNQPEWDSIRETKEFNEIYESLRQ